MDKARYLKQKLINEISYIPHSRVHSLKTFNTSLAGCSVKRDDELGFGVSGSKKRKYVSLIPYLLKNKYQEVIVVGGAYSNHVLSMCQLLIENSIKPTLFLLGNSTMNYKGNLLLTSLLVPKSQVHWISRKDWPQVQTLTDNYIRTNELNAISIPEGACMGAALPGASTLAIDILQNEQECEQQFQHIFMDAGTGLSAIATILAFAWLDKPSVVHVLLLAEEESQFLARLKQFQQNFEQLVEGQLDWSNTLAKLRLYRPTSARSFGSVNTAVIEHIKLLAREEGFFVDPIYSAKLFWEAKNIIISHALKGNILIIHSGGALTLMGFQDELSKSIYSST